MSDLVTEKTEQVTQATQTIENQKNNNEKFFAYCAKFALLIIFIFTAFLTLQQMWEPRDLWYSDEVRHADVYNNMRESGEYFALKLNGEPYPDKPPVYFWFMLGLEKLTGFEHEALFFFALIISSFMFIFSAYFLARLTKQGQAVALISCLILLSMPYFMGLTHYLRMDMLFASFIIASHFCLYKGFSQKQAYIWLILGFSLAAIAALIKGPYGVLMPLLSIIFYLVVKLDYKRARAADGVIGFAVMLIILFAWLAILYFNGYRDYLNVIASEQIIGRAANAWHHANKWYYYLISLPLVFFSYIFVPFFANWKNIYKDIKNSPNKYLAKIDDGTLFILISVIVNFVMVSAVSTKIAIYLLPLFPFIAILLAKCILYFSEKSSKYFYYLVGGMYLIIALALAIIAFSPHIISILPEKYLGMLPENVDLFLAKASGIGVSSALFFILALVIIFVISKLKPKNAILACSLAVIIAVQPLFLMVAPSLSPLLSTKAEAKLLSNYSKSGYTIVTYRLYKGVLSYYAGQVIKNVNDKQELEDILANNENVAVFMTEKNWQDFKDTDLDLVERFFMAERFYVVLARSKADTLKNTIEPEELNILPKPIINDEATNEQ